MVHIFILIKLVLLIPDYDEWETLLFHAEVLRDTTSSF